MLKFKTLTGLEYDIRNYQKKIVSDNVIQIQYSSKDIDCYINLEKRLKNMMNMLRVWVALKF